MNKGFHDDGSGEVNGSQLVSYLLTGNLSASNISHDFISW